MLLKGKTVLITGASRGIGKATAECLAKHGANLILISRNLDLLNVLKKELKSSFEVQIEVFQADVRILEEVKMVFKSLSKSKNYIDVLVNNAGIMEDATLQMAKPEMIENIYQTNVFGSMYCAQQSIKHFLRKKQGSIINLSSIIGTNGNLGQTIYGSSKAAIIGFTKSLSKELASLNIRVNAIAPGFIDTDMTKNMDEKFYQKNLESIAMKRIGKPEDIAKVVLFLASDLSDYVTGQIIGVDGGMVI